MVDMEKIGVIFQGQGTQFEGMGKELYERYEKVKKLYDKANEVLKIDIKSISFESKLDELTESRNAQPAIYLYSLACYTTKNLSPIVVAGHSLGEYTALTIAGVIGFEEGLKLVRRRGELMSETKEGSMSAIIGIEKEVVEDTVEMVKPKGVITVANYNSPSQIVISGEPSLVSQVGSLLISKGAKRVINLKVSGAFHSDLMKPADVEFRKELEKIKFLPPKIEVALNSIGKVSKDEVIIKDAVKQQMTSPVRWVDCIKSMKRKGVTKFVEIGKRGILSKLIREIEPEAEVEVIGG